MKRGYATTLLLFLTLAISACATSGVAGGGRNPDVISSEELRSVTVTNLYEAVHRLRPRWLRIRSSQTLGGAGATRVLVYQNQTKLGGIEVLRELTPETALWMEYMDGPQASASLPGIGSQDVEGAIIIHTTARS